MNARRSQPSASSVLRSVRVARRAVRALADNLAVLEEALEGSDRASLRDAAARTTQFAAGASLLCA
jgi:hypothetical protein